MSFYTCVINTGNEVKRRENTGKSVWVIRNFSLILLSPSLWAELLVTSVHSFFCSVWKGSERDFPVFTDCDKSCGIPWTFSFINPETFSFVTFLKSSGNIWKVKIRWSSFTLCGLWYVYLVTCLECENFGDHALLKCLINIWSKAMQKILI